MEIFIFLYFVGFVLGLTVTNKILRGISLTVAVVTLLVVFNIAGSAFKGGGAYAGAAAAGYIGIAILLLFAGSPSLGYCTGLFSRLIYDKGNHSSGKKWIFTSAAVLTATWPLSFIAVNAVTAPIKKKQKQEQLEVRKEKKRIAAEKHSIEQARLRELYNQTYEIQFGGTTIYLRPRRYFYLKLRNADKKKYQLPRNYGGSMKYLDAFLDGQNWPYDELQLDGLKIVFYQSEEDLLCSGELKAPETHFCLPHIDYAHLTLGYSFNGNVGQKNEMIDALAIRSVGKLDVLAEGKINGGRTISRTYRLKGHQTLDDFVFKCQSKQAENAKLNCKLSYLIPDNLGSYMSLYSTDENLESDVVDLLTGIIGFWNAIQIKPED